MFIYLIIPPYERQCFAFYLDVVSLYPWLLINHKIKVNNSIRLTDYYSILNLY